MTSHTPKHVLCSSHILSCSHQSYYGSYCSHTSAVTYTPVTSRATIAILPLHNALCFSHIQSCSHQSSIMPHTPVMLLLLHILQSHPELPSTVYCSICSSDNQNCCYYSVTSCLILQSHPKLCRDSFPRRRQNIKDKSRLCADPNSTTVTENTQYQTVKKNQLHLSPAVRSAVPPDAFLPVLPNCVLF